MYHVTKLNTEVYDESPSVLYGTFFPSEKVKNSIIQIFKDFSSEGIDSLKVSPCL